MTLFLRQVLTSQEEYIVAPGFSTDPLEEQHSVVPWFVA